MVRSLVESSRLVAVHGEGTRTELLEDLEARGARRETRKDDEEVRVAAIRLGHGRIVWPGEETEARKRVRARYGMAEDAVLFGVFGGLTPEKRVPQILAAFRAILPYAPGARLLFGGAPAAHYDIVADVAAHGLADRVTVTGYLGDEEELTGHIAACDVTLNLRWPTARETSGPWLHALAAGRATIVTDLVHLADTPSLDPRTWTANGDARCARRASPVCVAIDILDEDHSLRLAMRRLAADADLRAALGAAAREWWTREHSLEAMVADYERVMRDAASRPDPVVELPAHMRNAGDRRLRALLEPFGVPSPLTSRP
jgi:glycosyltransferase involved in cell wall biosynthesis